MPHRATLLLVLTGAPLAQDAPLPPHAATIEARALEAHVRFLASDAMAGRETGSPELNEAARYLARVLARAGVEPAGDDGSFLQAVPLERLSRLMPPDILVSGVDGEAVALRPGQDVSLTLGAFDTGDLRVLTVRSPEEIPATADPALALFLDATASRGRAWLEERGHAQGAGFGAIVHRGSSRARRSGFRPQHGSLTTPRTGGDADRAEVPTLRVHGDWREAFEEERVERLRVRQAIEREVVDTSNVVGWIPGVGTPAEPGLAQEAIVFTAHYDHIGTRAPSVEAADEAPDADLVYNGADDDASGVAAVLELAEAFGAEQRDGRPPARTLVFLLVTGEERGLLGTHHYLDHPVVPLERTVCNLNFEMIGRPDELAGGPGGMWLTGHERTNLFAAIEAHGIAIHPDRRPEENFFARSDNYAFAVRGVVAQTLSSYGMHADYHRVSDEADTLHWEHMEACTRAGFAIARRLADGTLRPAWLPGGAPPRR